MRWEYNISKFHLLENEVSNDKNVTLSFWLIFTRRIIPFRDCIARTDTPCIHRQDAISFASLSHCVMNVCMRVYDGSCMCDRVRYCKVCGRLWGPRWVSRSRLVTRVHHHADCNDLEQENTSKLDFSYHERQFFQKIVSLETLEKFCSNIPRPTNGDERRATRRIWERTMTVCRFRWVEASKFVELCEIPVWGCCDRLLEKLLIHRWGLSCEYQCDGVQGILELSM